MKIALPIVAALLFASSAALAQTTTPAGNADPRDPNEVICHAGKPVTGSRINGPAECHTRAQWAQMERDAEMDLDKMQRTKTSGSGGG